MKTNFLLLLLVCIAVQLFGQRKFSAALELSAGISESTQPEFNFVPNEGVQFGRNAFLKGGYYASRNLEVTLGVGLMNIHALEYVFFGSEDVDLVQNLLSHQYIAVPVGLKYHFGSFYINPEIGIAFSKTHLLNHTTFSFNDPFNLVVSGQSGLSLPGYNKMTFPLFLNIGTEFDVKPVKILFGIKAYYSLNKMSDILTFSRNYYGVGVMTGVKF